MRDQTVSFIFTNESLLVFGKHNNRFFVTEMASLMMNFRVTQLIFLMIDLQAKLCRIKLSFNLIELLRQSMLVFNTFLT